MEDVGSSPVPILGFQGMVGGRQQLEELQRQAALQTKALKTTPDSSRFTAFVTICYIKLYHATSYRGDENSGPNSRQFEPFRAAVWGLEVLSLQEQAEMQARRAAAAERKKQMDGKPNQLQEELQQPLGSDIVSSFGCSTYAHSICQHRMDTMDTFKAGKGRSDSP